MKLLFSDFDVLIILGFVLIILWFVFIYLYINDYIGSLFFVNSCYWNLDCVNSCDWFLDWSLSLFENDWFYSIISLFLLLLFC